MLYWENTFRVKNNRANEVRINLMGKQLGYQRMLRCTGKEIV
jgi:hypothetical protein